MLRAGPFTELAAISLVGDCLAGDRYTVAGAMLSESLPAELLYPFNSCAKTTGIPVVAASMKDAATEIASFSVLLVFDLMRLSSFNR